MHRYVERWYRRYMQADGLVSFSVKVRESDLYIFAEKDLKEQAEARLIRERKNLEAYIRYDPRFLVSLAPIVLSPFAPPICRRMSWAAQEAGVGPMAAVAGAINEAVAEELLPLSSELIIENGGDLLVASSQERVVAIYAGEESPFSFKVGIKLPGGKIWGVATSSGKVGPSLSFGRADAVVVVATSAALADAWATSLANRVRTRSDVTSALRLARRISSLQGVVVVFEDLLGVEGNIQLEKLI
ncbi:MAG: UPF0280 family protein [Atribacterota bacterium]